MSEGFGRLVRLDLSSSEDLPGQVAAAKRLDRIERSDTQKTMAQTTTWSVLKP